MTDFRIDKSGVGIGSSISGGTPNRILYLDSSGLLATSQNLYYDATTVKLGSGSTDTLSSYSRMTAFGQSAYTIPLDPYGASSSEVNDFNSSYSSGDTIVYRVYAYRNINGQRNYSSSYAETSLLTFVNSNSSVNVSWNEVTDPDGFAVFRNLNSTGYNDYYDAGLVLTFNDNVDTPWIGGSPDQVEFISYYHTTKTSAGATLYSVYGNAGYFDYRVGIGVIPTVRLDIYETNTSISALRIARPQHTSTLPSAFANYDENNWETVGFTSWAGGGGNGGYGAIVLGNNITGSPARMGEISGRNTATSLRLCSLIFQNGATNSTGQVLCYGGTGGAFNIGWLVDENGRIGLGGNSSPTAKVHLAAGTTTANYSPLKFTSGSLLTVAEAGSVEFLTDKWYATITTGSARKELTLNDAALTSGRVPFITTNGRLTDDSDMTFATDTLTITKIAATTFVGNITISTKDIVTDTTTGTKIATGTTQKIGFFNATPVVQQGATTDLGTVLSNLGLRASGTAYPITTSGTITLNAKITTYNSIATEGYGVSAIVDSVSLTNQGADITTTNMSNAGTAGLYRVSYVLEDTISDLTAGTVTLTISWTDGAGATTATANQLLTGTGRVSNVITMELASGNLTYATTHTGTYGSSKYALYITTERLN